MRGMVKELADQVCLWNSNLRSKMLRLMLRRVLDKDTSTGDPMVKQQIKQAALDKIAKYLRAHLFDGP